MKNDKVLAGRGKLTWPAHERRTDRYGCVFLLESGDSTTDSFNPAKVAARPEHLEKRVALKAVVIETRQSTHIGDLFHGVYPVTPSVGETITLGVGLLFLECRTDSAKSFTCIGVRPFDDDRETMWMDIHALYRAHEQTVDLIYEVLEPDDAP